MDTPSSVAHQMQHIYNKLIRVSTRARTREIVKWQEKKIERNARDSITYIFILSAIML